MDLHVLVQLLAGLQEQGQDVAGLLPDDRPLLLLRDCFLHVYDHGWGTGLGLRLGRVRLLWLGVQAVETAIILDLLFLFFCSRAQLHLGTYLVLHLNEGAAKPAPPLGKAIPLALDLAFLAGLKGRQQV